MEILDFVRALGLAALLCVIVLVLGFRTLLILEHERGLIYRFGRFRGVLGPGVHWINRLLHTVSKIDMRERFVSIPGQEVLSSDNVSIKISLAASFHIEDPYRAVSATTNYLEALYLSLQLALRDLVGATPIDELLARRQEIAGRLLETAKPQAGEFGLALRSVGIKDVMFPAELKAIFSQVVNAQKEGLASLERARGESAALRNLANSARLLQENPELLRLRLIQAVTTTSGNTIVLNLTDERGAEVIPLKNSGPDQHKS